MKLILAGSRNFNDIIGFTKMADLFIKEHLQDGEELTILSGGCRGTDYLAECYAESKGYKFEEYPANWLVEGLAAGPIRNEKMAKNGTHLLLFSSGGSGSTNMLEKAQAHQ